MFTVTLIPHCCPRRSSFGIIRSPELHMRSDRFCLCFCILVTVYWTLIFIKKKRQVHVRLCSGRHPRVARPPLLSQRLRRRRRLVARRTSSPEWHCVKTRRRPAAAPAGNAEGDNPSLWQHSTDPFDDWAADPKATAPKVSHVAASAPRSMPKGNGHTVICWYWTQGICRHVVSCTCAHGTRRHMVVDV